MARQAIQDSVDVSVDAVADLTTLINDVRIANGTRVWVSGAGVTQGLWLLNQVSAAAVDGLTVVATLSGVGRWIYFGAGGGSAAANLSVANEAALTALGVSAFLDGAQAYVQSHRTYWTLRTQALALRPNEIIASNAAARQWIREPTAHLDWAIQYAPNVFVDPTAGDNENDGLTNVTALKTTDEVARRVPTIIQPVTINVVGSAALLTPLSWSPTNQWDKSISASAPSITLLGVETNAALPAGANGVIATATNGTAATNTPPRLTDSGGAGIVWVVGTVLRATSGASNGAWAVVIKNEGAGVARTSLWRNAANTATIAPPAINDTYVAVTQTVVPDLSSSFQGAITLSKCNLTRWTAVESGLMSAPGFYTFNNCVLPSTITFVAPLPGAAVSVVGSYLATGQWITGPGVNFVISGCGVTTAAPIRCQSSANVTVVDTMMQGTGIACAQSAGRFPGGNVRLSNAAFWDNVAEAILVQRGGEVFVESALWGAGSLVGTRVRGGGHVFVKTGITPTLNGATELELQGRATAITDLFPAAGGALPNAAALTTWANWANAGTFNRNVFDYTSGASIVDSQ